MSSHKYIAHLLAAFLTLTLAIGCDANDETIGQPADRGESRHFVLVHGAWMGAWAWNDVASELTRNGQKVTAIDLPAHGDDATVASDATLAGYVQRVDQAIAAAGAPVILVGHSMAGMVISQVAEQHPEDIAALVYVAAYLPQNDQSLLDLAYQDQDAITGQHLEFHADGTAAVTGDAVDDVFCADCSPAVLAGLLARTRPEPAHPLEEKVVLTQERFGSVARAYIKTLQDRAVSPALQALMLAATPADVTLELDTSHSPLLSAPIPLTRAILEAASKLD